MKFILTLIVSLCCLCGSAQTNLLKDGSFENQKLFQNNQLARIASFADLDKAVQTTNPLIESTESVVMNQWYKKASNSGYLTATVTDTDSFDGDKSLLLSIGKNSPQKNLDKWDTTAIMQYVGFEREGSYILTFNAKSNIDCDQIFVGGVTGNGAEIEGSKWVSITSEWAEYSVEINPSNHALKGSYTKKLFASGAVVIGLSAEYDSVEKTKQTSVLIDNVRLIKK